MAFLPFIGPALSVGKFLYDELAGDPIPGIARGHSSAQHIKSRKHSMVAGIAAPVALPRVVAGGRKKHRAKHHAKKHNAKAPCKCKKKHR
jgi:hypothetical protein